jgi:hypothetical protein
MVWHRCFSAARTSNIVRGKGWLPSHPPVGARIGQLIGAARRIGPFLPASESLGADTSWASSSSVSLGSGQAGEGAPPSRGLDLQYPVFCAQQNIIRIVGVHQRPPGIPALSLPTCWLPSPCASLSPARTTTEPPPHPAPSTDDASIPPARMDSGQRERCGMVPVFTANRSISLVPSFAPAASPQLRRRLSPWPPHRQAKPATELPIVGGK